MTGSINKLSIWGAWAVSTRLYAGDKEWTLNLMRCNICECTLTAGYIFSLRTESVNISLVLHILKPSTGKILCHFYFWLCLRWSLYFQSIRLWPFFIVCIMMASSPRWWWSYFEINGWNCRCDYGRHILKWFGGIVVWGWNCNSPYSTLLLFTLNLLPCLFRWKKCFGQIICLFSIQSHCRR